MDKRSGKGKGWKEGRGLSTDAPVVSRVVVVQLDALGRQAVDVRGRPAEVRGPPPDVVLQQPKTGTET